MRRDDNLLEEFYRVCDLRVGCWVAVSNCVCVSKFVLYKNFKNEVSLTVAVSVT